MASNSKQRTAGEGSRNAQTSNPFNGKGGAMIMKSVSIFLASGRRASQGKVSFFINIMNIII